MFAKDHIITHRGLESSNKNFYPESSFEAFQSHLSRGFSIEFDVNFLPDDRIVISHQVQVDPSNNKLCLFDDIIDLIGQNKSFHNAMHLKGRFQKKEYIDRLILKFRQLPQRIFEKLIIFDVKPDTARILKSCYNNLVLAPSVAHPYDIARYNRFVSRTLYSVDEIILLNKKDKLYQWAWLDEWDRFDRHGQDKKFYEQSVFERLRKCGLKIALVTPELHATSPGLLGGEAHRDGLSKSVLLARIEEILCLSPDALCTDYPEEVYAMTQKN